MKSFIFNENKVCVNPSIFNVIKPERSKFLQILTAEKNGKWSYGINAYIQNPYWGLSYPACDSANLKYDTEEEAIKFALNYIVKICDIPLFFKKIINLKLSELSQLKLF